MSFYSSRIREAEHQSTSACQFEDIEVSADVVSALGDWSILNGSQKKNESEKDAVMESNEKSTTDENKRIQVGVGLASGITIRIAPMDRKCGGWDKEHFHPNLKPSGKNSFIVTFEATARECIAVALSPDPDFAMGKTYAIHIGAGGNLSTVIRRWLPSGEECVEATFSTIRVCADFVYKSYWVLFQTGKIFVGTGKIPGRQCAAMLDDSLYDQLRPGQDKISYIGFGNSSLHRHARDLKVRKVVVTDVPDNLDVSTLAPDPSLNMSIVNSDDQSNNPYINNYDRKLLQQYHEECAKAQSRAIKYNTPVDTEPPGPDAFLKWSEARRLRANPEPGFITGIDVTSEAETLKRKKRKERFERDERMRKLQQSGAMDVEGGNDNNADEGIIDDDDDNSSSDEEEEDDCLPVQQAWDNIDFIREYRIDPPSNNDEDISCELVPEKIHLFAIDWAAFKQMRSDDIMAYFSIYGPSYVEWLSELSCNVIFQDKFSAVRAMQALSQEIPSPPPFENDNGDNMHVIENKKEGEESESNTDEQKMTKGGENKGEMEDTEELDDLGAIGWRFCLNPFHKIMNDRFGRKGTKSRLLMRVSTTLDVLEHRPTEAPAPPPGFTTKKILGPGSDFPPPRRRRKKGKNRKNNTGDNRRNKRSGGRRKAKRRKKNKDGEMDEPFMETESALDQGLKAKR